MKFKRTLAVSAIALGLSAGGGVGTAHADSCLSVASNGVCLDESNPVIGSLTVGGQTVTTPGPIGPVPVAPPVQVCLLITCYDSSHPIATVPSLPVPPETVTVPVIGSTPPIGMPYPEANLPPLVTGIICNTRDTLYNLGVPVIADCHMS
jgi:hypothetical protein